MTFLLGDIADHLKASVEIADAFTPDSQASQLGVEVMIFPEIIPQRLTKWEQAIVLNDISNQPEEYLGGEVGTHESIIQIDVWTDGKGGRKRVNELAEKVRNRLNGYRGQFGEGVFGTAHMIRNNTIPFQPIDGTDNHKRRVSMDFRFIHTADIPTFS